MANECPKCQTNNPDTSSFCADCGTPLEDDVSQTRTLETPSDEFTRGYTFAGRYEIIEELGKGGMGRVYRAMDKELKEEVAIKLIRPDIASDRKTIERFKNELKLARKIRQKNVGSMYELLEDKGVHFITMEYISGQDLTGLIRQAGQLTVGKSISIAKQVCDGLAEAHRLGVVHRDLKPSNIMIDTEGFARIMDFGIARSIKRKGITGAGMMIGTPEYMSPEQVEGKDVDQRSDIYSLGIILFKMATGKVPFEGDTPFTIGMKHKSEEPKDPKELNTQIPDDLSSVILRCLEKDKEKRYQTAEELVSALTTTEQEFSTTEKIGLEESKKGESFGIPKTRWKWIAALITTFVIIFGSYYIWKRFIQSPLRYENHILVEMYTDKPQKINKALIEFALLRSLAASTKLNILVQDDITVYKRKTEFLKEKPRIPLVHVMCDVYSKVAGFETIISVRNKGREFKKKFECKGDFDFISSKIDHMISFIAENSENILGKEDGEVIFSEICTEYLDALNHFLKGEDAWKKLNKNTAYFEYKTAIDIDPKFSLAHLRLAEVLKFFYGGTITKAREHLEKARENENKLIENDVIILEALWARLDSNLAEERRYRRQLTESFPFKKEYHYEFAESYFLGGEADEAINYYSDALEIDPNYNRALNHIAYCYAWKGNHKDAERHITKYVKLDNTANAYDSLGSIYMFAGRYEEAITALNKAIEIGPTFDYLYGTMAKNYLLKGLLAKAIETLKKEMNITQEESVKHNASFFLGYAEFLRGNIEKSSQELNSVRKFYSEEPFVDSVDESPNLSFWLTGIIYFKKGDLMKLNEIIRNFEQKISTKGVSATNYFRIYKFYNHLIILKAFLQNDKDLIRAKIEEGRKIKDKMGYWASMFNLSFFFNEYAKILIEINRENEALELLNEAIEYNPNYPASYINLAEIHLNNNDLERAQEASQKAQVLLNDSDKDFILVTELEDINRRILMPNDLEK